MASMRTPSSYRAAVPRETLLFGGDGGAASEAEPAMKTAVRGIGGLTGARCRPMTGLALDVEVFI